MNQQQISIDFELIWKKIHTSLSMEEEDLLNSWLEEDISHREYFDNARIYYQKGSGFEQNPVSTKDSWDKISDKIKGGKRHESLRIRKRPVHKIIYAASVAAFFTILFSIFLLKPEKQEPALSSVLENRIEPGSKQATLILGDGSTYDLSRKEDLSIEEGGAIINSTGETLEYVEQSKEAVEMKFNTLSIPRGGEFFLTLSDGTKVWLNSESSIRYPVQFTADKRTVELVGEAYFEVKKDERRPFQVITGEQVTEVLGTSFNLSSYSDDEFVYTTLVEGEVNIFLLNNPEISQKLSPNGQSKFQKGTMTITHNSVLVDEFIAWKDGSFSFSNQDLSRMMKTVSRWYDLDVRFENPAAMNIEFTGQVKRYENFEKILVLIEKTNEVKFEIDGNAVLVR